MSSSSRWLVTLSCTILIRMMIFVGSVEVRDSWCVVIIVIGHGINSVLVLRSTLKVNGSVSSVVRWVVGVICVIGMIVFT